MQTSGRRRPKSGATEDWRETPLSDSECSAIGPTGADPRDQSQHKGDEALCAGLTCQNDGVTQVLGQRPASGAAERSREWGRAIVGRRRIDRRARRLRRSVKGLDADGAVSKG